MIVKFSKGTKIAFTFGVFLGVSIFTFFNNSNKESNVSTLNKETSTKEEVLMGNESENTSKEIKIEDNSITIETVPIEETEVDKEIKMQEEKLFKGDLETHQISENKDIVNNSKDDKSNLNNEYNNQVNNNGDIKEKEKEINIDKVPEISITNKFISPSDMDFLNLGKTDEWINLSNYINNLLGKSCGIYFYDNYLSYNNNINGPTIELYKNKDEYVLFLYGILNEESFTEKETKEKIKLNNIVLTSICKAISKDYKELYDIIYKDYETESTLSDRYKILDNLDFKIKAETMTNYVIYSIKEK